MYDQPAGPKYDAVRTYTRHIPECHESNITECSICYVKYEQDDTILVLTNCRHLYHKACFEESLRYSQRCASCRIEPVRAISENTYTEIANISTANKERIVEIFNTIPTLPQAINCVMGKYD